MAKQKFYAVARGRETGIFKTWNETKNSIDGYKGALYKSFPSLKEAESWLKAPIITRTKTTKDVVHPPEKFDESTIVIYSDGGSINNPGPGGYGSVIIHGENIKELTEGFRLTTNNRMELLGVISGLRETGKTKLPIKIFSDSQYVINGISKGWAKKWKSKGWKKSNGEPALNSDLWEELLKLTDSINVDFHWVKGHAGNHYNERCDELAVKSARSGEYKIDLIYEENNPPK